MRLKNALVAQRQATIRDLFKVENCEITNTSSDKFRISEVDSLEVLSIVDNSVDFLSTTNRKEVHSFRLWTKRRYGQEWTRTHTQLPFAEHGFSMLIRVLQGKKSVSILFDTGISANGVVENTKRMGIELTEVDNIVLSHGHYDHFGGIISALKTINKCNLPIIIHEDMLKNRGTISKNGTIRTFQDFPIDEQINLGHLIETKRPYLMCNKTIMVTGEIPRETSFEKGFSQHRTQTDGIWKPDPLILDDRAIVLNVKDKGLVVISGCAHAGIINTIFYSKYITGVNNVYAVMGGFHLAGKDSEERIEPTIKELLRIKPKLIAPSHCTGWKGMYSIANSLPNAFVFGSVGNLYEF
jgi:7,8-dihydropterin-6-yl-methyl-4-(beta-D-ribofuranosyl)aminobenzene 5'-phosphate synthase